MEAQGFRDFRIDQGLDALGRLLAAPAPQVVFTPVDWARYGASRPASALVADLVAEHERSRRPADGRPSLRDRLAEAPAEERLDLVDGAVRRVAARVLRLPEAQLDVRQPFGALGLDSLMAIELRNRLEAELGLKLSATLAWNYPTVADLAAYLLARLGSPARPTSPARRPTRRRPAPTPARLRRLVAAAGELDDDAVIAGPPGRSGAMSGATSMSAVKLALLAKQVREQVDGAGVLAAEPIAIIGMGCRFPGGADSPDGVLGAAAAAASTPIGEVPRRPLGRRRALRPRPRRAGQDRTRAGAASSTASTEFDAAFFGISPREAARMDPQQRLLLEVACEALERAGQPRERLAGQPHRRVRRPPPSVDYADRQYGDLADIDAYTVTGNVHCIIANRCRTCSTCGARAWRSTRRARRRWSPSTWPARACATARATWRSPAA